MTRQHPQSAKAAEAKTEIGATTARRLGGVVTITHYAEGGCRAGAVVRIASRYGVDVPPGEAFTLTEEQVAEWRKGR